MVALVVGLLLLAGVLQILLGNRESFDAQRSKAHLQENARLASFILENTVAHAGYRTELDSSETHLFPEFGTQFAEGAVVSGQANTRGQSDTLRVRFQGEGGVHNCRGTAIGTTDEPQETSFELYVNDDDALICHVIGGDRQPLVENVDRFEVRYGLDTDNSTTGVDRYVSDLTGFDATQIRSVRVQLLLRSAPQENLLPTASAQQFSFSDRSTQTFTDRRGRLLLDQTIALRNSLP
ncbi:hypothetical protein GCM10028792_39610 [Salinisphaera aquimarina]